MLILIKTFWDGCYAIIFQLYTGGHGSLRRWNNLSKVSKRTVWRVMGHRYAQAGDYRDKIYQSWGTAEVRLGPCISESDHRAGAHTGATARITNHGGLPRMVFPADGQFRAGSQPSLVLFCQTPTSQYVFLSSDVMFLSVQARIFSIRSKKQFLSAQFPSAHLPFLTK